MRTRGRASRFFLGLVLALLASAVAARAAWELQAWEHGSDPALWTRGDAWLTNPDPNAYPLLRRGMALLSIQCRGKQRVAFLNHNFEVEPDRASVALEIDGRSVPGETWAGDSGNTLEAPDPVAFVARLLGHERLRMVVTWPGTRPTATTFLIAGLDHAIEPLQKACGW